MSVDRLTAINPAISNISWYRGNLTPQVRPAAIAQNNYSVQGNPNHPAVLNNNSDAGPIVTFDLLA